VLGELPWSGPEKLVSRDAGECLSDRRVAAARPGDDDLSEHLSKISDAISACRHDHPSHEIARLPDPIPSEAKGQGLHAISAAIKTFRIRPADIVVALLEWSAVPPPGRLDDEPAPFC
jgi:hypothetical protein